MSTIANYQEKAKQPYTSIKYIARASEKLHVFIGGEEVPADMAIAMTEWITKNLVLGVTSFSAGSNSLGDDIFVLNMVSQGEINLTIYCEMTGCALPSVNACHECGKATCRHHSHPAISDDERDVLVCSGCFYGYVPE